MNPVNIELWGGPLDGHVVAEPKQKPFLDFSSPGPMNLDFARPDDAPVPIQLIVSRYVLWFRRSSPPTTMYIYEPIYEVFRKGMQE